MEAHLQHQSNTPSSPSTTFSVDGRDKVMQTMTKLLGGPECIEPSTQTMLAAFITPVRSEQRLLVELFATITNKTSGLAITLARWFYYQNDKGKAASILHELLNGGWAESESVGEHGRLISITEVEALMDAQVMLEGLRVAASNPSPKKKGPQI